MLRSVMILLSILGTVSPAWADSSLLDWAKQRQGRSSHGIYVQNKKAGWSVEDIRLNKRDGKDVLTITEQMYLKVVSDGETTTTDHKTLTVYSLEGDGPIIFAESINKEDKQTTTRTATLKDGKFVLVTTTGKRKSERTLDIPKDTLARKRALEQWLVGERKPGDKHESFSVSWEEDDIDTPETYTFTGRKTQTIAGIETTLYSVSVNSRGAGMVADVLADGRLFAGKLGGIFEMRTESEEVAKKMDGKVVDLMAATSVQVSKSLGNPKKVKELTLTVTGLGEFKLPQSHRQKLTVGEKGVVTLELKRDFKVSDATPLSDLEKAEFTKSTASLQSDNPAIKQQAAKIIGEEKDPLKIASKLQAWVYKTTRKTMAANADNALTVLDQKAGDCTEHTLLFVALARAAGLPAREVGGLAYAPDVKPYFAWHAWAEIHDGRQWVSIDPTWNEVYVDATHIKFQEGPQDLGWINVVGNLKFEVVDFKKD